MVIQIDNIYIKQILVVFSPLVQSEIMCDINLAAWLSLAQVTDMSVSLESFTMRIFKDMLSVCEHYLGIENYISTSWFHLVNGKGKAGHPI